MQDREPQEAHSPLPRRRQPAEGRAQRGGSPPMVVQSPYDSDSVKAELETIHSSVQRVSGLLVASRDGLVLAADTHDVEDDSVAAMAAAAVGLAAQFTGQARVGEPRAAMFEGAVGYVCVFPIEAPLLLVVFGEPDLTMGLFNVAAKQALALLQQALVRQRVNNARATRRTYFEPPPSDDDRVGAVTDRPSRGTL
jgi:uncharacterized protein